MGYLRAFCRSAWQSMTLPAAYHRTFVRESWEQSLRYLFSLLAILLFFQALAVSVQLLSVLDEVRQAVGAIEKEAPNLYPEKLVLTISNGKLRTNVKEPFSIDLPAAWMSILADAQLRDGMLEHFLTINTRADVEAFEKTKSLMLVTKDAVVLPKEPGYQVVPLRNITEERTVTKEEYDAALPNFLRLLHWIPRLVLLGAVIAPVAIPIIGGGILTLWKMAMILIPVTVLFLVSCILRRGLDFGTVYRLSLHGLTLPVLYVFVEVQLIGRHIPLVPTLLFLCWMMAILVTFPRSRASR